MLAQVLDILSVLSKKCGSRRTETDIVRYDHPYSTVCMSLSVMDSILGCIFGHICGVQPITAPSCVHPSVCPSVSPSISQSVRPSVRLSVTLSPTKPLVRFPPDYITSPPPPHPPHGKSVRKHYFSLRPSVCLSSVHLSVTLSPPKQLSRIQPKLLYHFPS